MNTPHWSLLVIVADALDDAESARIAVENRVRAMRQVKHLQDTPAEAEAVAVLDAARQYEKDTIKRLDSIMARVPVWSEWGDGQKGIGKKSLGRLLGVIGNPIVRVDPETGEMSERTLAQLRSYCGYGDPATQKRRKGEKGNWNAEARKRLHLLAVSCMRQPDSPYRCLYDKAREEWADRDTSDGHKHAHALRMIVKQGILPDLYEAAKEAA